MSRKKTISSNIKYNIVSQGVVFAVSLALFPFIVSHVGKEIYGVYLLVTTFIGYLGVFDFGLATTVTKYIAESVGRGENEKAGKIINSSLLFYIIIGLVTAVVLLILSFCFDRIFKISGVNSVVMRQLFWVAAVASLFIWPGKTFDGVLYGLQRFDWLAINNISVTILTAISAYFVFANNLGMVWFLSLSYFLIILRYLVSYIIVRHCIPEKNIRFPYFDKENFKMIFSFSSFLFLSSLLSLLIFDFDSFVIGVFTSVAAVTLYNVGYNLQSGFRAVNGLMGTPIFPASADMEGKKEQDKQKELLFKGTKYTTMIFIPMVLITIVFAKLFINNWMGIGFFASILPAQVLIAFWLFNNTLQVGGILAIIKGYIKVFFKIDLLNASLNVILSLILVRRLGILGVVLGTTIPMVLVSFPLYLYQILKIMKVSFRDFFNSAIKKNIWIYLFAILLSFLVSKIFQPSSIFLTIGEMGMVYAVVLSVGFFILLSSCERKEILFMVKF